MLGMTAVSLGVLEKEALAAGRRRGQARHPHRTAPSKEAGDQLMSFSISLAVDEEGNVEVKSKTQRVLEAEEKLLLRAKGRKAAPQPPPASPLLVSWDCSIHPLYPALRVKRK